MATQIINTAISYSYTLLYPCGETDLSMIVNNSFTNNEPFVGLSISDNGFTFIREDADEVRSLIASGYDYWLIYNTWQFHLDFNNYEDDGIILKVPCISTSIKDVLQNTTLESLGVFKHTTIPINKIVASRYKLSIDENFWFDWYVGWYEDETEKFKNFKIVSGKSFFNGDNLCEFSLPLKPTQTAYSDGLKVNIDFEFTPIYPLRFTDNALRLRLKNRVHEVLVDGTETDVIIEDVISNFAIYDPITHKLSLNNVITLQNGLSYPSSVGGNDIISAVQYVTYDWVFYNGHTSTDGAIFYNISGTIEFSGAFQTIETNLPAISLATIESKILSTLGYSVSTGLADIYVSSANTQQLLSTKILDLYTTLALVTGNCIVAYGNSLYFDTLANIINSGAVSFAHKCKTNKKGKILNYAYIIGGNENVDLILDNAPSYFWKQTYKSSQLSTLFAAENVTPRLIIDGAYIADKIGTNDNAVFVIDNRNNNLNDGTALPINYNFSASEICNNRMIALISETLQAVSFSPSYSGDVIFTNPDSGITSEQTIYESAGIRLAPYTEEFEVPMTSALITQIMGLGLFYKAEINGDEYLVESCTIKMQPQQCALIVRKILSI